MIKSFSAEIIIIIINNSNNNNNNTLKMLYIVLCLVSSDAIVMLGKDLTNTNTCCFSLSFFMVDNYF